jgi:hypothetical protein
MDEYNFDGVNNTYSYPEPLGEPIERYKKKLPKILHRYLTKTQIAGYCNLVFNRDEEEIKQWCEAIISRTRITPKGDYNEHLKKHVVPRYTELQRLGFMRGGREKTKDAIGLCLIHDISRGREWIYPPFCKGRLGYDSYMAKCIAEGLEPEEKELIKKGRKYIATKAVKKSPLSYLLDDHHLNLIFKFQDWVDMNKFERYFPCERCEKRDSRNCEATLRLFFAVTAEHLATIHEHREIFWKDQRKRDYFFVLSYICSFLLAEEEIGLDIMKDAKEIYNIIGIPKRTFYRRYKEFKNLL